MVVPTSKAPANKKSTGRFHRMISFAAVVLLIASMNESFNLVFLGEININRAP